MVPKEVIAWRKVRASAWKLISGVSSGVRLSEDNLKLQKITAFYPRHTFIINIGIPQRFTLIIGYLNLYSVSVD